ncbi:MAG: DUF4437 domain-containing protein [Betaproteobacteria bacterium]|nr:DUF4437 domain-containing protein [Betaproteobacteria bacterium]
MKYLQSKSFRAAVLAAALLPAFGTHSAPSTGASVSTPVTELKYGATGVKNATGELQAAPAYGDLAHGAHGTFIKMPAGFVSNLHTHTGDYYGVVISGVAVNVQVNGKDVPLPVGSYWLQKGGEAHVTKCISPNECIFFISQPAKFDYVDTAK